jgi:hypothetical protein
MDLLAWAREASPPFARLLDIRYVAVTPERVVAELPVRDDLCTVPAVAHGGARPALTPAFGHPSPASGRGAGGEGPPCSTCRRVPRRPRSSPRPTSSRRRRWGVW